MNNCGTCEHWAEGAQGNPARGNCERIKHADDVGGVDHPDPAVLNETSGIASAWLETRSSFGCTLHQPRV